MNNDRQLLKAGVKDAWLSALRSGVYKQGKGALHDITENSYCCLGVLCDVIIKKQQEGNDFGLKYKLKSDQNTRGNNQMYGYEDDHSTSILPLVLGKELEIQKTVLYNQNEPFHNVVMSEEVYYNLLDKVEDSEVGEKYGIEKVKSMIRGARSHDYLPKNGTKYGIKRMVISLVSLNDNGANFDIIAFVIENAFVDENEVNDGPESDT